MTTLPKYSNEPNFVGYPLWYIIDDHKAQCNECATVSKSEGCSASKQVNWEDTNLWAPLGLGRGGLLGVHGRGGGRVESKRGRPI